MSHNVRKLIRTVQSQDQAIKAGKEWFYAVGRRLLGVPHERDFRVLSRMAPSLDGCYVDVGANRGQSIESILQCRPNAEIVSFEPNAELADNLVKKYRLRRNVRVHPFGLGDCDGASTLFIPVYNGVLYEELASLERQEAETWLSGQTMYRFRPDELRVIERRCEVRTLDSFSLKPLFIKIDAQGFEYNILRGSRETLQRYRPLLLVEGVAGNDQITSMAQELGYEEYFFDGNTLRRGCGTGDNSFLITPDRMHEWIS